MSKGKRPSAAPATSPEAQEARMVSLAVRQAERMLEDGTAPTSMVIHYLKLGTTREQLEQERLRHENEMLQAKTSALATQTRSEELFQNALQAFSSYKPTEADEDD